MKLMAPERLQATDSAITEWMARHGPVLLRVSLGIVFLWFGILKFFRVFSRICGSCPAPVADPTYGTGRFLSTCTSETRTPFCW
jgi:hypothetical protein